MIVVDASVAVQWFVVEAGHEISATLLGRADLVAPDLLLLEVGNALRRKARDGEVTSSQAIAGVRTLIELVDLRAIDHAIAIRATELALSMKHPIYDCVYLAFAEANHTFVVTGDATFRGIATEHGYERLFRDLPLEATR